MSQQINPLEMKTRYMAVRLTLDSGQFPSSGNNSNQKTVFGNSDDNSLTIECEISKQAGFMQNNAFITIYGMTVADCQAFSRFNSTYQLYANKVEVFAGYEVDGSGLPPLVFIGSVYTAGADFNNPSRPFRITAVTGIYDMNLLAPHTNVKGNVELNTLFKSIIAKSGNTALTYVPTNVQGIVSNPVYTGSWIKQLQQAAFDYGYQMNVDNNKVMITPKGQAFNNDKFVISKDTGMLGYPIIVELGIDVKQWFNPAVQFGQSVTVQSTEQIVANGDWYINGYSHNLQNRGEKWLSVLKLNQFPYTTGAAI